MQEAINNLQTLWRQYLPETPFEFTFLDNKFQALYNSENQQGNLFTIFSLLAIIIVSLGFFGFYHYPAR